MLAFNSAPCRMSGHHLLTPQNLGICLWGKSRDSEQVATNNGQPILLWSAGNWLKYYIQQNYFGYHYVWCSPIFEGAAQSRYAQGAGQPPSSDPATIYRNLHAAVVKSDQHDNEIARQSKTLKATALMLSRSGVISQSQAAEVAIIIKKATIKEWRPLLYAIPYALVANRVQAVPVGKRASIEPEFIIPDLKDGEFHIIEPMPC
jgi:hypothetical protein